MPAHKAYDLKESIVLILHRGKLFISSEKLARHPSP